MKIMLNEPNQVPQLVKSTDPSTIVSVTQIEGAIMDWECERLRNFIKRQFKSRYRDIMSPTSSRVMHPRAERGELRLCITLHEFPANAKMLLYCPQLHHIMKFVISPISAVEEEKSPIVSLHDQDKKEADDSKVSFMTMDDEGNVVDIFGREYSRMWRILELFLDKMTPVTVVPSDEEFIPCLECYNSYLTENMESWKKALSKNKLPKPLGKIAKEIGQSCRAKCGKKMPSNKKLKQICEFS